MLTCADEKSFIALNPGHTQEHSRLPAYLICHVTVDITQGVNLIGNRL